MEKEHRFDEDLWVKGYIQQDDMSHLHPPLPLSPGAQGWGRGGVDAGNVLLHKEVGDPEGKRWINGIYDTDALLGEGLGRRRVKGGLLLTDLGL